LKLKSGFKKVNLSIGLKPDFQSSLCFGLKLWFETPV